MKIQSLIALLALTSAAAAQESAAKPDPVAKPDPIAGYSNGSFFLRDPNDWFVLFPKGRLQIDGYFFPQRGDAPAGVENNAQSDPRPKSTVFVRRARAEVQGTLLGHFDFHIAGEFASTPATGSYGTLADAYVIVDYLSFLKLQVGQFDVPFTFENRTSDKYFDFMERSVVVRAFGVPQNKDSGAMIKGWLPRNVAHYELGLFNGEYAQSFKNQDNNLAIIGRAFVAPLAPLAIAQRHKWMEKVWVGGSFWWQKNTNLGQGPSSTVGSTTGGAQNDLPGMTTQGGVSFFSTSYGNGKDAMMNSIRTHLVPDRETIKGAVELNVPIKWAGVRAELVYQKIGLAEYNDTAPGGLLKRPARLRTGELEGIGYYIEAYGWLIGDSSFMGSSLGLEDAPRYKKFTPAPEPRWGLMVAAKYEHIGFNVRNLSGTTDPVTATTVADPAEGRYALDVFELGLNAWGTKHVRLSANYVMNYLSGDATNMKKNYYFEKFEHELLFRVGIAL
jgi:phosphate-selective porin